MVSRVCGPFLLAWCWCAAVVAQADAPAKPQVKTPLGSVRVLQMPAGDAATPRWRLWVAYEKTDGLLLDHAAWLDELQGRLDGKSVQIGLLLPRGSTVVGKLPHLLLAEQPGGMQWPCGGDATGVNALLCDGETLLRSSEQVDPVAAILRARAEGGPEARADDVCQWLDAAWSVVGDGEAPLQFMPQLVAGLPLSGQVHGLAALEAWWCRGDHAAALRAIDAGCKALAGESVPMAVFVDLVLRGDRTDPAIARRLAFEMAAVAAAADGPFTQLVYLRALLRAGQDRNAGRLVATLQKRLAGHPVLLMQFAEILMEAKDPAAFRELAERAVADAERDCRGPLPIVATRHSILTRCGDREGAAKLMVAHRAAEAAGNLNASAWYAMVRPASMGRSDSFALAQCEEMQRVGGLSYGDQDTVALALFRNGRLEEAVALQTQAAAGSGGQTRYEARLRRFRDALARSAAGAVPKVR